MDSAFDRARFTARLATRRFGRQLVTRAETASTNDDAWDLLATGLGDGAVVIADHQTRGRGRAGRAWHSNPGQGLAMSVLVHLSCDPEPLGTLPLVAGLSLAHALDELGVHTDLKWPNDLLLGGGKLAGILCESRRTAAGIGVAVVGVGVNVGQRAEDFPPELRERATSLALAGHALAREDVAAVFLNAFEPQWAEHAEGDRSLALNAWRSRARFWGQEVVVRAPGGDVRGIAADLDLDGALVVETASGSRVRVVAGDIEVVESAGSSPADAGAFTASVRDAGERKR
jgi:BirA family biotin operon repressor/biotin-[acetyl-CoA-carboxylase] ligase